MLKIARCESGQRQYNSKGKVIESVTFDFGYFQINRSHIKEAAAQGYDIMTPEGNIGYALYLYRTQGTRPWDSSSRCWKGSDIS